LAIKGKILAISIFASIALWAILVLITADEQMPVDGANAYGFPIHFYSMHYARMLGETVNNVNYGAHALNVAFVVGQSALIYFVIAKFLFKSQRA